MPAGRSSGAARSFCGLVLVRKRLADGSYGWPKIPAFRAGRRARTARTKQERGPLAPAFGCRKSGASHFFDSLRVGPGTKRSRAPLFQGASRPAAAPPGTLRFPPTPKGNKKPGPMLTGAWPMKRCQERARQRRRSLGQSRCPCLTGSGGFIRPAAGYRRKPTAPASARLSPCA